MSITTMDSQNLLDLNSQSKVTFSCQRLHATSGEGDNRRNGLTQRFIRGLYLIMQRTAKCHRLVAQRIKNKLQEIIQSLIDINAKHILKRMNNRWLINQKKLSLSHNTSGSSCFWDPASIKADFRHTRTLLPQVATGEYVLDDDSSQRHLELILERPGSKSPGCATISRWRDWT